MPTMDTWKMGLMCFWPVSTTWKWRLFRTVWKPITVCIVLIKILGIEGSTSVGLHLFLTSARFEPVGVRLTRGMFFPLNFQSLIGKWRFSPTSCRCKCGRGAFATAKRKTPSTPKWSAQPLLPVRCGVCNEKKTGWKKLSCSFVEKTNIVNFIFLSSVREFSLWIQSLWHTHETESPKHKHLTLSDTTTLYDFPIKTIQCWRSEMWLLQIAFSTGI